MKKRLASKDGNIATLAKTVPNLNVVLASMTRGHGTPTLDLYCTGAAICREERVTQNSNNIVCMSYLSVATVQNASYCDCLSSVLISTQLWRKYRGGLRLEVFVDWNSRKMRNADRNEEHVDCTISSRWPRSSCLISSYFCRDFIVNFERADFPVELHPLFVLQVAFIGSRPLLWVLCHCRSSIEDNGP